MNIAQWKKTLFIFLFHKALESQKSMESATHVPVTIAIFYLEYTNIINFMYESIFLTFEQLKFQNYNRAKYGEKRWHNSPVGWIQQVHLEIGSSSQFHCTPCSTAIPVRNSMFQENNFHRRQTKS